MNISIVAAMTKDGLIGKDGGLPWRLSDDLAYFQKLTQGHVVVMGRKTYESIPDNYRPLSNRTNIVLTRHVIDMRSRYMDEMFMPCPSAEIVMGAFVDYKEEIFVIGGGMVYNLFLPACTRMYLTFVDAELEGDTYFPEIDNSEWNITEEASFDKSSRNEYPFKILRFDRINKKEIREKIKERYSSAVIHRR